jgi:phospholipid/cholesterol/gamma-HCH transport system substrate-binding protein
MATTTPPPRAGGAPEPLPPPSGPPGPPRPVSPPPRSVGRWIAAGALALVVGVLAYIVFSGGGGANYKFELENASQIVLGDQVQVGGVPVGSITGITLTHDYRALVTIHVEGSLVPLHEGTTAQIRVPSLTTVAGRYVALSPGPNNRPALPAGATLPPGSAQGTTDLDQLFDTLNPRTRKGLQELLVGTAEQYAGATMAAGLTAEYFSPALSSANHIFTELTRDQHTFTEFLVQSAKALATLGAHHEALTQFVDNGNQANEALGAEQASLQHAVAQLPATLQAGNRAFAQAPSTFAALRHLANVAGPDTKLLAPLFKRLEPLVVEAGPVLHNLSVAISRPGPSNDLTDAALALPTLAKILQSGSPNAVKALQESVPVTALWGPYAPDLEGAVRDFGTSAGYYDGNGNYARVAPVFDNFTLGAGNTLTPVTPPQGLQGLHTHELLRCPGSGATPPPADGSAPFTDSGQLGCDPTQVP